MNRMPALPRSFRNTLIALWIIGIIAGLLYAFYTSIPSAVAIPLLAAFLVELSFYLVPGFRSLRAQLERRFSPHPLALGMTASAAVPYVIYAAPVGAFRWLSLAGLCALAAAVSFWYVLLPRRRAVDLLFLVLVAAVVLSKVFPRFYPSTVPRAPAQLLGQLMWIRLGVLAALSFRRAEGAGFGFLPTRRDWAIGIQHYLMFIPVGVLLGLAIGFARFDPHPPAGWQFPALALATFLGMLWVVALSEEFFFRGLLQRWLSEWLRSQWTGLVAASILFGLLHLPFRSFPNWRFALLASVAGFFYGHAFLRTGNIRAAMVAHALVNTTWRLLFS